MFLPCKPTSNACFLLSVRSFKLSLYVLNNFLFFRDLNHRPPSAAINTASFHTLQSVSMLYAAGLILSLIGSC
jgi:hypothetical protein